MYTRLPPPTYPHTHTRAFEKVITIKRQLIDNMLDECLVRLCEVPGGASAPEADKHRQALNFAPWFEKMAGIEDVDDSEVSKRASVSRSVNVEVSKRASISKSVNVE
jgi:hypothetical protein